MPRGVNMYDEARIQGRNVANAGARFVVSPGIVTEGLVLHIDAANVVSYPGTGTTWFDMTDSRNNGTLTNGPVYYRDGIGFDGVNDYVTFGNILNFTTQDFSFEIAIYLASLSTTEAGQGPILFFKGEYQSSGYHCQINSEGTVVFYTNQASASQITSSAYAVCGTVQKVYIITIARQGPAVKIYVNGVLSVDASGSHTNPASSSDAFLIGAYGTSPIRIFNNFAVYYCRVYNRALNSAEVAQNYNATRIFFGI